MPRLAPGAVALRSGAVGSRVPPRLALVARRLAAGLLIALGPLASAAWAQDVDWLVNINDTGSDPAPAGGDVVYGVAVANNGTDAAPATTVSFSVPATATFVGSAGAIAGCTPAPASGPATVTCSVPALAPDGTAAASLTLRTSASGTITVVASVPTSGDADPTNNAEDEATTITSGADVALSITGPATVAAGGRASITLTAANQGPDAASGVVLTLPAPTGLTDLVLPSGCSLASGVVICPIPGPIASGASASLTITGQASVAAGSTITVAGDAGGGIPPDPRPANDTDTLDVAVTPGTDLAIAKSRSPSGPLVVGDAVTFDLVATYTGDAPSGIAVADLVPPNYAVGAVTAPGWSCSVAGQAVTCTKASGGAAGADVALGPISIAATAAASGTPVNTATIGADAPADPDPSNDTATDGGAAIADPFIDLRANKSGPSPALVVEGSTYGFPISATNLGNAGFSGTVVLTDSLPPGLSVTGYGLNGWACSPAASPASPLPGPTDVTCTRTYATASPLGPNATTPAATIRAEVTQTGRIDNTVAASSPDGNLPDGNPANDAAGFGVTASAGPDAADLAVLKTAALPTLAVGEVQTFTVEVVNAGPRPATDVVLTDTLTQLRNALAGPAGAGYVGATIQARAASGVACSTAPSGGTGRSLSCTIAALPVCTAGVDCPTVAIAVRPGGEAGTRSNAATAFSRDVADPDTPDNRGTASFEVTARADVAAAKSASPATAVAGQNLVYVVTASDLANGLSGAEGVTVEDALPTGVVFLSAVPSAGSCVQPAAGSLTGPGNDRVGCAFGRIANGAQRTVTVTVRPTDAVAGTTLTNEATVATTTAETDAGNDVAAVDTPVAAARLDLLVNKTDSVDPVAIGSDTAYTVTVRNLGPSAAEEVVVSDQLPASRLRFRSFSAPGDGACGTVPAVDSLGGTLECTFPVLLAGESRVVTVTLRGDAKGVATNGASVSSSETAAGLDGNLDNNEATENTTVRTRADVEVASKVATPSVVNLREDFTYAIRVRNNGGTLLSEADGVSVADALPAGMRLTGTPSVALVSGSATLGACTGAAGGTSFACSLGTLSSGGEAEITVPVEIVSVATLPQTFSNSATVTTTSFDVQPSNDTGSGAVTVGSSSLSGTIFRDFNDDALLTAGADTGLVGVAVTLAGTSFDGASISLSTTTGAGGAYAFPFIPAGTYRVGHGALGESHLDPGTNSAGSAGGTLSGDDAIEGIAVPTNAATTGYDFAKVPQARLGVAKGLQTGPTTAVDGSFAVTFRLRVRNLSLEPLQGVRVTDALAGSAPSFGSHVTLANPTSDPMTPGTYTILPVAVPGTPCGGRNAAFNGSADTTVASGFALAAGTTCNLDIRLRVQPAAPLPPLLTGGGRYRNQASAVGEGTLSGQTQATNAQLSDLSDNGTSADPNSDGRANEAGENDPTPVSPATAPAIALVKVADLSALGDPVAVGDIVTYRFTVTNRGNAALTDVTVADPLLGAGVTGTVALLRPGQSDSTAITGTYALTAADLDARSVTNQATASGTWSTSGGTPQRVSDPSGTGVANDTPTVVPLAGITLVKAADLSALSSPPLAGDIVTFRFTVANAGSTPLTDVTIADALPGVGIGGGPILSLAAGASDSTTITGTYALAQADIDAGAVANQATASGTYGGGRTASDLSGATPSDDGPTTSPLARVAAIELVKSVTGVADSNGDGLLGAGDTVSYAFQVRNRGNVALGPVVVTDPRAAVSGSLASLAPGATDAGALTATAVLTQADADRGFLDNSATVTAPAIATAGGAPILVGGVQPVATDISDTGTAGTLDPVASPAATETPSGAGATDRNPGNDPTPVPIPPQPRLRLVKSLAGIADTTGNGFVDAGDTASYAFTVVNAGNVALAGITVGDPLATVAGGPVTLAPGASDASSFTATYLLSAADVAQGFVDNAATASGNAVTGGGAPILAGGVQATASAVSDSGTDAGGSAVSAPEGVETPDGAGGTDGDPGNDPTVAVIAPAPRLSLVKSAVALGDADGDGLAEVGDVVSYAFAVTNTGNVALAGVAVADPLVAVSGGPIDLAIGAGDAASLTATYALTQADIDRGFVENAAVATATAVRSDGAPILDPQGDPLAASGASDAGTTPATAPIPDPEGTETPGGTGGTDGDPANDPTLTALAPVAAIELVKSVSGVADANGNGRRDAGEVVSYAFSVRNRGNVALGSVTVSDPLAQVSGGPVTILAGESDDATFTATYALTQADVDRGFLDNSATAAGQGVTALRAPIVIGGTALAATDVSDAGTDAALSPVASPGEAETPSGAGGIDADPTSDPTPLLLAPQPSIALVKSLVGVTDVDGDGLAEAGDVASFAFAVTNAGSLALVGVTVADPLAAVSGGPVALAIGATDDASLTASYVLTQDDVGRGFVENGATATGSATAQDGTPILEGGAPVTATDVSDAGTDPMGAVLPDPGATETPDGTGATDGDPGNDPTLAPLVPGARLVLVKSVADVTDATGNGLIDAGDAISYAMSVENVGNVALAGVSVSDPLVAVSGGPVDLAVGAADAGTFTATYVITQADVDRGFVQNVATVAGAAVTEGGAPILDGLGAPIRAAAASDAGTDPDGVSVVDPAATETPDALGGTDADPGNDPTTAIIGPVAALELVKSITGVADSNDNGLTDAGDVVSYAFRVRNLGTVRLGSVTVTDPLATVSGASATVAVGAIDEATFTATYALTQADVDRGFLDNSATATGQAVTTDGQPILDGPNGPLQATDVSDAGTDAILAAVGTPSAAETPSGDGGTDADPGNDPTPLLVAPRAGIVLVKSLAEVADTNGNGLTDAGDTLSYAFALTNAGNVALAGASVSDPLAAVSGGPVTLAPGVTDDATFTATYVLTQADVDRGFVQNSAAATGRAVTENGAPILDGSGEPVAVADVSDSGTDPGGALVPAPGSTETPDGAGATDGDPGNDPTLAPLAPMARLVLVKSVASVVDATGNGLVDAGDAVSYAFSLTNTGNVALAGVTVADPLVEVAGGPVSLAIGATDASTFAATYVLTQADVDRGFVRNAALAEGDAVTAGTVPILDGAARPVRARDASDAGTDPTGALVAFPQETETPDALGGTDADPGNDPTTAIIGPVAAIELVKSVVEVADANGNGLTDAGDAVSYAFRVRNMGSVALGSVRVSDPLVAVSGSLATLAVSATDEASFTATYILTQADVDRGFLDNSATATGEALTTDGQPVPDGSGGPLQATDLSDAGTDAALSPVADPGGIETPSGAGDPDADPSNDPTPLLIGPQAGVRLVKSLTGVSDANGNGLTDAGDTASFAFAVTNSGNVALAEVAVADPRAVVSGGPVSLAPGATDGETFTATHALTQDDLDRGFVENSATVTGQGVAADGTPVLDGQGEPVAVTDVSDSGTGPDGGAVAGPEGVETPDGTGATDGDPGNDPTVAPLAPVAALSLVKSVDAVEDANGNGLTDAGDAVTYAFALANRGSVALAEVTVVDPLAEVAGGPVILAVGATDAASLTATYVLTQADLDRGFVQNSAAATGRAVGGDGAPILGADGEPVTATDVSDAGTDREAAPLDDPEAVETPDGAGATDDDPANDPTLLPLTQAPVIALVKAADASDLGSPALAGQRIAYAFVVTNAGNVTLRNVTVRDALPGLVLDGAPIAALSPGETDASTFTGTYALTEADLLAGRVENQATATGEHGAEGEPLLVEDLSGTDADADDPTVVEFQGGVPGGLTITKVARRGTAYVGDVAAWTVAVSNPATGVPAIVDVTDALPQGFAFVEGSVEVDGAEAEAEAGGGAVTVRGVALAPGATVSVTLDTLVTEAARPGEHTNRAHALDPATGAPVTDEAEATVRVLAEPVFDCATVIGRVFDDLNQDGSLNGAPAGEPGLPAARLVAPDGLSVTSDAHGRFSLPCAALPRLGGANLSLRLDERSLPTGYRLTTENPRVVRVTPGMITEMNFGAALSRLVRIDLAARAFTAGAEPRPELVAGLARMVAEVAGTPSMLRLTYAEAGEGMAVARARVAAVERLLRDQWPARGRYQLNVEAVVIGVAATD